MDSYPVTDLPCAGLGHPFMSLSVHRCQHRASVTLWTTLGTADEPTLLAPLTFGPFDSPEEIRARLLSLFAEAVDAVVTDDLWTDPAPPH